jgi:hypothetical protein
MAPPRHADRHSTGVGPFDANRPRSRLVGAPFGMDTQQSASRHFIAGLDWPAGARRSHHRGWHGSDAAREPVARPLGRHGKAPVPLISYRVGFRPVPLLLLALVLLAPVTLVALIVILAFDALFANADFILRTVAVFFAFIGLGHHVGQRTVGQR